MVVRPGTFQGLLSAHLLKTLLTGVKREFLRSETDYKVFHSRNGDFFFPHTPALHRQ